MSVRKCLSLLLALAFLLSLSFFGPVASAEESETDCRATCPENAPGGDALNGGSGEGDDAPPTDDPGPWECDHDWVEVGYEPGYCEEPGWIEYECVLCGTRWKEYYPPKGHVWDSGKVIQEPTSTEPGIILYTCVICDTHMEEEIPPTWDEPYDHDPSDPSEEPAVPDDGPHRGTVQIVGEDERLLVIGGPYGSIEILDSAGKRVYWEGEGESDYGSFSPRTAAYQRLIPLDPDEVCHVIVTADGDGPLGLSVYSFTGSELLRLCALERECRVKAGDSVDVELFPDGMTVTGPDRSYWPTRILEGEEIRMLPVTVYATVDGTPRYDEGSCSLCRFGEVLRLRAPETVGLPFSGWFRAGESELLSVTEELYFFVDGEAELEARFSSGLLADPSGGGGTDGGAGRSAGGPDTGILLPILLILLLLLGAGLAVFLLLRRRTPKEPQAIPVRPTAPETIVQMEPPDLNRPGSGKKP